VSVTLVFSPGICLPIPSPIDSGVGAVSNVVVSSWGLLQTVSATSASSWNVTGYGISATQQSAWNAELRINAVGPFIFYGLSRPVVYPMDDHNFVPGMAWRTNYRTASTYPSSWKTIYRTKATRSVSWETRYRTLAQKAMSYRVLMRIYKPGQANEELNDGILQRVVHAISSGVMPVSPGSAWALAQRRAVRETSRFNTLISAKTTKSSKFNTQGILVTPQKAAAWTLLKKVSPTQRSTWTLYRRTTATRKTTWRALNNRSVFVASTWRFIDPAGKVTPQVASSWLLKSRIKPVQRSTWQLKEHVSADQASAWRSLMPVHVIDWHLTANSPGNIGTPIVHPIDFSTPAAQLPPEQTWISIRTVHPISFSLYNGYGFTASPGSTWLLGINPNGRVTSSVASSWEAMNKVSPKKKSTWNAVGRISATTVAAYNQRNSVKTTAIMEWNVGLIIQGQIRQTAIDRTDFSY
jgi:hypothetical protein